MHQSLGFFCLHAWFTFFLFFSFIIRLDLWRHLGQSFFLAHERSMCIASTYIDQEGLSSYFFLGVSQSQLPLYILNLLCYFTYHCLFGFYFVFELQYLPLLGFHTFLQYTSMQLFSFLTGTCLLFNKWCAFECDHFGCGYMVVFKPQGQQFGQIAFQVCQRFQAISIQVILEHIVKYPPLSLSKSSPKLHN